MAGARRRSARIRLAPILPTHARPRATYRRVLGAVGPQPRGRARRRQRATLRFVAERRRMDARSLRPRRPHLAPRVHRLVARARRPPAHHARRDFGADPDRRLVVRAKRSGARGFHASRATVDTPRCGLPADVRCVDPSPARPSPRSAAPGAPGRIRSSDSRYRAPRAARARSLPTATCGGLAPRFARRAGGLPSPPGRLIRTRGARTLRMAARHRTAARRRWPWRKDPLVAGAGRPMRPARGSAAGSPGNGRAQHVSRARDHRRAHHYGCGDPTRKL